MVRWALLFLAVVVVAGAAALLLLDDGSAGTADIVAAPGQRSGQATKVDAGQPPVQTALTTRDAKASPLPAESVRPINGQSFGKGQPVGPTRTVSGVLLRASDRSPLAECSISVRSARQPMPGEAADDILPPSQQPDQDGRFTLSKVPLRAADLIVSPTTGSWISVALPDSDGDLADLQLLVNTGFIVEGSVIDAFGSPIEGALITLADNPLIHGLPSEHRQSGQLLWAKTKTDSAGSFRLRDVAPMASSGPVTLVARAPGFIDGEEELFTPPAPSVIVSADYRLRRSGAIAGTVLLDVSDDAAALAANQARVAVDFEMTERHGRPPVPRVTAVVDSANRYTIDGVPPGRYVLQASAAGVAAPQWQENILVTEGHTTVVDWVLSAGGSISGRVVDTAGRPLAAVPLRLEHVLSWDAPGASGSLVSTFGGRETRTQQVQDGWQVTSSAKVGTSVTDDLGRYAFAAVPDGELKVTVMAAPPGLLTPSPQEIEVWSQAQLRDISFVMKTGEVLRGRVQDDVGRPLPDARAQVNTVTDVTSWDRELGVGCDDDGRFSIGGLAADEELTLWVTHSGFADSWQRLTPDEGLVVVELKPSVVLNAVVLVAETGLPLPRYEVTITQGTITRSREVSDALGRFALELDDDVPVTITVSAEGRRTTSVPGVRPSESQQRPVEIRLPPGG